MSEASFHKRLEILKKKKRKRKMKSHTSKSYSKHNYTRCHWEGVGGDTCTKK